MNDPLLQLICDALGLMNRAFVDPALPASGMYEFYHQFRKLWDRGIPVGMGLGHLLIMPLDDVAFGIHRLGEHGRSAESLAAIRFARPFAAEPGFARTLAVTFQPAAPVAGIILLHCDRGRVTIIE